MFAERPVRSRKADRLEELLRSLKSGGADEESGAGWMNTQPRVNALARLLGASRCLPFDLATALPPTKVPALTPLRCCYCSIHIFNEAVQAVQAALCRRKTQYSQWPATSEETTPFRV